MIQAVTHAVDQHPLWTWLTVIASAALAWIAPIAGLVAIVGGLLQAYISWQKYKHWKESSK